MIKGIISHAQKSTMDVDLVMKKLSQTVHNHVISIFT